MSELPTGDRSIFVESSSEEKRYFRMIDDAAKKEQEKIISNSVPAHAVYIIHKFLSIAQQSVDICTGSLRRSFKGVRAYADPELAKAAVGFLNRGGRLRIIIMSEPDLDEGQALDQHALLAALSQADVQDGCVTVHINSKQAVTQATPYHFIVMDDKAVRLEIDPEEAEAYVSFNHKKAGKGMSESFEWMLGQINEPPVFAVPQAV